MVDMQQLSTGYHHGKKTTLISHNIDATLPQGTLTSLLGPNGAGKSTLLRTLSGLLPPIEGEVKIDGKMLGLYSKSELSRKVAIVLTDRPAVISMTVEELVALGRSPYTGFSGHLSALDREVTLEAMAQAGVADMRRRAVSTLSDGERQKVMIAKALAQATPIIFLDEPSAFLDYPSKVELMLTLRELAHSQNKTILLSTHDLNIALQLSDRLMLVDKNIGSSCGTPRHLAENGELRRFFPHKSIELNQATCQFEISFK